MKHLLIALAALPLIALPAHADERGKEIVAVMEEYLRLWNAHDANAVATRIYFPAQWDPKLGIHVT